MVIPPRYLLGGPKWDPMVVWLISLAVASTCGWAAAPWVFLSPGENPTTVKKNCQPLSPQGQMGTFCFPLVRSFGLHFVPSIGLKDIIAHIESLTKFTQQAFNDSQQSLSLLNTEMCLVRKAILQKRMALDVIAASQGGTCAVIQTGCCVFIPDESANVSSLLNHVRTQVIALSDQTPSLGRLTNQWFRSWDSQWKKIITYFGNHFPDLFSPACASMAAVASASSAARQPPNEPPPC